MEEKLNKDGKTLNEFLAEYDSDKWRKPSLTADVVLFSITDSKPVVLLVKRGNHPYIGDWALPGGFVGEGESCETAALRELKEETGLDGVSLDQLVTVSTPGRDPRGWTVSCCFTGVTERPLPVRGADDAADASWFSFDCELKNDTYRLVLKNRRGDELETVVDVERYESGEIDMNKTRIVKQNGLAFDHAKIILNAIEKL